MLWKAFARNEDSFGDDDPSSEIPARISMRINPLRRNVLGNPWKSCATDAARNGVAAEVACSMTDVPEPFLDTLSGLFASTGQTGTVIITFISIPRISPAIRVVVVLSKPMPN